MPEAAAYGNPEVIELLEAYLETAKSHRFGSIAIAMTIHGAPGKGTPMAADFAGDISLEAATLDAVKVLHSKIATSVSNWSFPPRDDALDASHVRYNVANGPLGFDFLVWLVDAEMTRVLEGAPGPLKVAFWLGNDAAIRINQDSRRMWLENVFRPCLQLIGAVEDDRALHGRCKELYLSGDICKMARAGVPVPKLIAPTQAYAWLAHHCIPPNAITITLREADHWPHRNSNLNAWFKFADDLTAAGETVIFIRDTAYADVPLVPHIHLPFRTFPLASTDLLVRAALYESAKCNLFVSNGPASLAFFGVRPFLMFCGVEADDHPYVFNTREFWTEKNGIAPGEQYPWSAPSQRIVWERDTYDAIKRAWMDIQPLL